MTKILGVIPARIGSTRVTNKMLEDICGKTLIQRTYERSLKATMLDALVVATDSDDIEKNIAAVGARVIRWPLPLSSKNGTEGVALALSAFKDFTPDIVVNIWGDEPLYPASVIDDCVKKLIENPNFQAVTAADKIEERAMLEANSVVKIVTDLHDRALYISRSLIPHTYTKTNPSHYHVIGAMAMRTDFLWKYISLEQTPLELAEGVEQLRILEHGYGLGVVKGEFKNLGVNTPHELEEVRKRYSGK